LECVWYPAADMSEPRAPAPPSFSDDALPAPAAGDPLEGDWSEGMRGPLRANGIPQPRRISLVAQTSEPDETPPEPTSSPPPDPLPESAPTPWSEPVPETTATFAAPVSASGATNGWDMPAPENQVPAPDDAWAAAPAEPAQEWQAETAPEDWQEVRKPEPAAVPEAPPTDWSSLRTGPDWAAPAPSAEAANDAWGGAPPAPQSSHWSAPAAPSAAETEWAPPPSDAQWAAPAAAATGEWEVAISEAEPASQQQTAAAPSAAAPAWNAPAVGASALEQLDSEPMAAVPGAANDLFGSVPAGGSLGGNDDDLGPPEELAAPEEVLRPVAIDDDDQDLPQPTGEPPRTRAQPLAAWRPAAVNAMAIDGEHRVAVHTRGGRTLRGTMRDVDLSKSQFPLVPQGGGEPEAIYRADVKAIFFMLASGEPTHTGDGAKVRVTFADGRVIEGIRDGADAKHGFFLVPVDAARTNTRRIYVAREATSDVKDG
jgi:uncharacterized protein DUF6982